MSGDGKVYLVGAGPGDPGLITTKGRYLVRHADVVICDALVSDELLNEIKPGCELIDAGKRSGHHRLSQSEIHRLLIRKAKQGLCVVRLQGGDPLLFGRGGEEMEALRKSDIPYEVVPGVSSVNAVPAYAGIPLTHRDYNSSVTVVTAHGEVKSGKIKPGALDWFHLAQEECFIMLMGLKTLELNMKMLMKYGMRPSTPVAVIEWGTFPQQRCVSGTAKTIAQQIKHEKIGPPALIMVGAITELRKKLRWFEKKSLFAKHILVTRARQQSGLLSEQLRFQGARVSEIPTIEIAPPKTWKSLDQALSQIHSFDWILFTSVNGVEAFFERLYHTRLDVRALAQAKIGVIGPTTGEKLRHYGLRPDLIATQFRAEGLLKKLPSKQIKNKKILLARAQEAREILPDTLRKRGAHVCVAPVYRSITPTSSRMELVDLLQNDRPNLITFASSSMVDNFVKLLSRRPSLLTSAKKIPAACIGPITTTTARQHGFKVVIEPKKYMIAELVKAVARYYK